MAGTVHWQAFCNISFAFVQEKLPLSGFHLGIENLGKPVEHGGTKQEVHIGILHLDVVLPVLLGHHASADADQQAPVLFLQMLELTGNRKSLQFGVFPDGTGIYKDQIRLFLFL